jgi:hypothetical protein
MTIILGTISILLSYVRKDSHLLRKASGYVKISTLWLLVCLGLDDILFRILTRPAKWSKCPWLNNSINLTKIYTKYVCVMNYTILLTPVSNRNMLLLLSLLLSYLSLWSYLAILIKAENPCSVTGGGSINLSFFYQRRSDNMIRVCQ